MDHGGSPDASSSNPTAQTSDIADDRPRLTLKPGAERRLLGGHPWVYANEIQAGAETRALPPGAALP